MHSYAKYHLNYMNSGKIIFHFIANAALGEGLSGGDRIFIELARNWAAWGHSINLYVWEEGFAMCQRNNLSNVIYTVWPAMKYKKYGDLILYLGRTIKGCREVLKTSIHDKNNAAHKNMIIYSASFLWPDLFPGLVMKWKEKNAFWITSIFLFPPPLFKGYRGYQKRWKIPTLREIYFTLTTKTVYWLIKRYADMVFVVNELDRDRICRESRRLNGKVVVIPGGVDTKTPSLVPEREKIYDGVFIGRLHPQKGVLELVDIWRIVVSHRKDAKLVIIGNGPLEEDVRKRIRHYNLENQITMMGFLDGIEKIKVFKSSKIVLHPAVYDSGGMAACEAMACGLPGISFDLPALKTYYPKGMLKTPIGDFQGFAENIQELLENQELYCRLQKEAIDLATNEWAWESRAAKLLDQVKETLLF